MPFAVVRGLMLYVVSALH